MNFTEFFNELTEFSKAFGEGLNNISIERDMENESIVSVCLKLNLKNVAVRDTKTVSTRAIETAPNVSDKTYINPETMKPVELVDVDDLLPAKEVEDTITKSPNREKSWVEAATEAMNKSNVAPAPQQTTSNKKVQTITSDKTLYGDKVFTDDEVYVIKSYLNREIKPAEAAELLNLKCVKEFNSLVEKYKRAHNITRRPKKVEEEKNTSTPVKKDMTKSTAAATEAKRNKKLDLVDWDMAYRDIKRGDSIANIAKDYDIPQSTFARAFHKFIKENNYEPIVMNRGRAAVKRTTPDKPVKQETSPREQIMKTYNTPETTTTTAKESVAARNKAVAQIGQKVDLKNGWQSVNGVFHLVKDGVIVK